MFHCVCEQQALQEAQEDLDVTQRILNEAKEKLAAVEEGIATLQAKYHECLRKRDELDAKCQLCENRLIRADKVSGEKPSHLSNFPTFCNIGLSNLPLEHSSLVCNSTCLLFF